MRRRSRPPASPSMLPSASLCRPPLHWRMPARQTPKNYESLMTRLSGQLPHITDSTRLPEFDTQLLRIIPYFIPVPWSGVQHPTLRQEQSYGRESRSRQGKTDCSALKHLQHAKEPLCGSARSIQASAHDVRELPVDGALLLCFCVHCQEGFSLPLHLRTAHGFRCHTWHSIGL